MLKKLRIFFTFSGIMLLLGTIVTDEWTSIGERISYAMISICILAVCQPTAFIRILDWLCKTVVFVCSNLWNCFQNKKLLKHSYTYPEPEEYISPAKISRGNVSTLSDDEMHVLLRYYYKADEIRTKIRGVSFRNDDGTDRQNILAHCHAGDQLRFKFYEYDGAPAYAVYCDWGQIGNLSADLAEEIAERKKPCILLGEILNISGGYHGEYLGCNICLNIYEKY